jgi:hypothetical protein
MRRLIFPLLLLVACSHPPDASNGVAADPNAETEDPFSAREKDTVRRQIEKNWAIDPAMPGLETMEAVIVVEFNRLRPVRAPRPRQHQRRSELEALRPSLPSRRDASEPAENAARQTLCGMEDRIAAVQWAGYGKVLRSAMTPEGSAVTYPQRVGTPAGHYNLPGVIFRRTVPDDRG